MFFLKRILKKFFVKKKKQERFILLGNHSNNKISIPQDVEYLGKNRIKFWEKSSNNQVTLGSGLKVQDFKITFKGHNSKVILGNNVRITGYILVVGDNRTVTIGDNTTIQGVYIMSRGSDITIGADCMFSRDIEIRSTDVHKIYKKGTKKLLNPAKNIKIGNRIWIGAKAFISKGSVISDGSIVGACSFVNKEFMQENVILAGTPAKIVKEDIEWER